MTALFLLLLYAATAFAAYHAYPLVRWLRQGQRASVRSYRRHRDRWPSESMDARVLAGEWEEQEDVTRN